MEIKVLGPGCAKCQQAEKVVKEAVAEAGVAADIEKVTDIMKIAGYGVLGTPAVVINGEVKSVGKIPKKQDVMAWLIWQPFLNIAATTVCHRIPRKNQPCRYP